MKRQYNFNLFPNIEEVKNLVLNDLQISDLESINPLFTTKILFTKELQKLVKRDFEEKEVNIYSWIVFSGKNMYLLFATELEFFSDENFLNDPYVQYDDFNIFAEKIKKEFFINNAKLYETEGGYYFASLEEKNSFFSFFAFEI